MFKPACDSVPRGEPVGVALFLKRLQGGLYLVIITPIPIALPILQILDSYVQFEVSHGASDVVSMQLSRSRVTDGEWHHLLIELKSAKEGKDIKYLAVMTLDYGMDQVSGPLHPLWNGPLPGPAGTRGDPARCQVLVDLDKCFLGSPEFGSPVPPYAGVLGACTSSLPRRSAPGIRNWTRSSCVSPRGCQRCLQQWLLVAKLA